MSSTTAQEVPTVTLGGVSYPVPDLTIDQLRVCFPAIMRWQAALVDPSKFTDANFDELVNTVYVGAVRRNDPKMTPAAFRQLAVPYYELMEAFVVIQRQTHMFRPKVEGTDSGEALPTT